MKRFSNLIAITLLSICLLILISATLSTEALTTDVSESTTMAATEATVWQLDIADEATNYFDITTSEKMQMGSNNLPHLVFGGDYLYYAYHNGSSWIQEKVDPQLGTGSRAVLALDSANNPHISYWDTVAKRLKYAFRSGGTWHIDIIDSVNQTFSKPSIELDNLNQPHITYAGDGILKYATVASNNWNVITVDTNVSDSWLALNSANQPVIAYVSDQGIEYASWNGSHWDITLVEATGTGVSLDLDSDGIPNLSYSTYTSIDAGTIKHAVWTGTTWNIQSIESGITGTGGTTIYLDTGNQPHIAYSANEPFSSVRHLKYALWNGASWSIQIVDTTNSYAESLILSNTNQPQIAYYDSDTLSINYASWTGTAWSIETVTTSDFRGIFPAMALDNFDNPHIVHYGAINGELRYTKWDGGQWSTQVVASGFDLASNPGKVDLDIDSAGDAHIAYVDKVNHTLHYAYGSGGTWNTQTIDSAGGCASLKLDAFDNPHIGYCGYTGGNSFDVPIQYAAFTGSNWITRTVDPGNQTFSTASMTLDSQDRPIFAYLGYNNTPETELRFASWNGASWDTVVVDTWASFGGQSLDITLDSNHNPYIYYAFNPDVKLAHWNGSNWITEQVGTIYIGQYDNPLVLDSLNQPHILYSSSGGTQYARKEGGIWITEPIYTPGSMFDMVIDGSDRLYISKSSNGSLVHLKETQSSIQETIDPVLGGTLVYTDTQGLATIVDIPAGAATNVVTVTLTPLVTPTIPLASSINRLLEMQNTFFAGRAFGLTIDVPPPGDYFVYLPAVLYGTGTNARYEVDRNYSLQQEVSGSYPLTKPITITMYYSESDISGLTEATLLVSNYDTVSGSWVDASTTCTPNTSYERNLLENWIRIAVCATGEFALTGQ